jgi:RecB family endonuclease NucS
MAIMQTIWKISKNIEKIHESNLKFEKELEESLQSNIEILNENWLIIGRQVITDFGKYIDLLAIDRNGSIIILEL